MVGTVFVFIGLCMIHPGLGFIGIGLILIFAAE
jgi:hypothetical protein